MDRRARSSQEQRVTGDTVKVYMCTDLEGVAGVVSFEGQTYATARYYDAAKRLLTAEINAAVDAMLGEGVDSQTVRHRSDNVLDIIYR